MPPSSPADVSANGTDFQYLSAVEAARNILAAMLNSAEAAVTASSRLAPSDFQYLSHGRIFEAVRAIVARGEVPDIVTVGQLLSVTSPDVATDRDEFLKVTEYTGVKQSLPGHIRVLKEYGTRRRTMRIGDELREAAANPSVTLPELLAEMGSRLEALRTGETGSGERFLTASTSASELVARDIPEPRSLLGNRVLTVGGFAILYGKPGVGKTWLGLSQALALVRGTPWIGLATPPEGARVGLLELELGTYSLQQRLKGLGFGTHERDRNLMVIARPDLRGAVDLVRSEERESMRRWIDKERLDLLIIDALSRAHTAGESDEREMGELLAGLDALRHESGCAIEPIHHERKSATGNHNASDDDDLDALRGHSRLQSDPTLLLRIKALRGGKLFTLRFAKVSEAATPEPIYFRHTPAGVEMCESPERVAADNCTKVRDSVPHYPMSVTNSEIQASTKLARPTVLKHLKALIEGGEVREIGSGKAACYCRPVTSVTDARVTLDNVGMDI